MLLAFHDNTAKRGLRRSEGRISSVATADDKVILAGWRQIVETTVDDLGIAFQDLGHRNRLVLCEQEHPFVRVVRADPEIVTLHVNLMPSGKRIQGFGDRIHI